MDPQCGFYFVTFPNEDTERQELFQDFYREDRAKKQFEASRRRGNEMASPMGRTLMTELASTAECSLLRRTSDDLRFFESVIQFSHMQKHLL